MGLGGGICKHYMRWQLFFEQLETSPYIDNKDTFRTPQIAINIIQIQSRTVQNTIHIIYCNIYDSVF